MIDGKVSCCYQDIDSYYSYLVDDIRYGGNDVPVVGCNKNWYDFALGNYEPRVIIRIMIVLRHSNIDDDGDYPISDDSPSPSV